MLFMSAATDKDYIDATVQAATARMENDAQKTNTELIVTLKDYQTEFRQANAKLTATLSEYQAEFRQANAANHARMDSIELALKSGLKNIEQENAIRIAQFEANLQRALSETIKWVAGTVIAGVAVSTSVTAFLISNSGQKSAPLQPIVIYAAPAAVPAAAPPPAISGAPK
ncbi:hypothetical protein [Pseudoduganella aquatica]|uniref:Uncharacterized protein n=1 Tax=Pseudoduganella aquatica TaxID=2660641 RepID=A0A7X4HGX7_9BURK|nr:hypothetical protein [Pseudoduganella aquatica]MYN11009.1 hypothetical protein [Pseudoduganella aquatica]